MGVVATLPELSEWTLQAEGVQYRSRQQGAQYGLRDTLYSSSLSLYYTPSAYTVGVPRALQNTGGALSCISYTDDVFIT